MDLSAPQWGWKHVGAANGRARSFRQVLAPDAQAAVWRDAVSSMPGNWLQRGGILIEYTRHVCRARLLKGQVARFEEEWLKEDGGLERFDKLLAMAEREDKAALACARALRLTPQAQMHPRTAGRMANDMSPYPSPWNFGRGRLDPEEP